MHHVDNWAVNGTTKSCESGSHQFRACKVVILLIGEQSFSTISLQVFIKKENESKLNDRTQHALPTKLILDVT